MEHLEADIDTQTSYDGKFIISVDSFPHMEVCSLICRTVIYRFPFEHLFFLDK